MTRILLLLEHRENRRLLAQWLELFYEVILPDTPACLEESFDLCILDGPALDRTAEWLQQRKEQEQPVFLPVLLIASRQEVGLVNRHLWQTVDELITAPIEKVELQARVEILLRTRRLSLKLKKANDQLEEINTLKSHFCSMVSHEFRNPLSTIYSFAQVLEIYGDDWPAEKKTEYLQRMQTSAKGMINLLESVLMVSQSDLGKLDYQPAPLDLQEFCKILVEDIQHADSVNPTPKHTQPQLIYTFHGDCSEAVVDRNLIQHILTNLLSNALKYSPEGGTVKFDVSCKKNQNGGLIKFAIKDQGIGIPKEDIPHLFEPFRRAKNVGKIPGTGLGLSIVKRCIDLHGGEISVDSSPRGTKFTITLPYSAPEMSIIAEKIETSCSS